MNYTETNLLYVPIHAQEFLFGSDQKLILRTVDSRTLFAKKFVEPKLHTNEVCYYFCAAFTHKVLFFAKNE